MSLAPVNTGDPHVAAHNAEREAINDLQEAATGGGLSAVAFAKNPDTLVTGTIVRDANGAVVSASVIWPDGTPGTYTADVISTSFPGAVDAYTITYGSPTVTKTYTQPTVTRDSSGRVTILPAIVVT